ncbi:hypothetical protein [Arenimonas sp.]|uniref:hypothetical protein n=1 Tax=Arenimonas sp. TaxID=1872635 RepID=UPI0039E54DDA
MPLEKLLEFLAMPLIMVVVFVAMFWKVLWVLADEVLDGGDFLCVRRSGIEQRILLSDVMNVSLAAHFYPPRLILRLRKPWKFGDELVFVPQRKWFTFDLFVRNQIAEDLIRRCDGARRAAT